MRFRECSKRSQYVHCNGHILNLITKDCISEVPVLQNILGTIQALYCFLEVKSKAPCHIHETWGQQLGLCEDSEELLQDQVDSARGGKKGGGGGAAHDSKKFE